MIDYMLLGQTVGIYKGLGYEYIDVPWNKVDFEKFMSVESNIESGKKYVACIPCVRPTEADESEFHHTRFMKIEMIYRGGSYSTLMMDAALAMKKINPMLTISSSPIDGGRILTINGMEVGVYRTRGDYCTGTGLSLPRFVQACDIEHNSTSTATEE